MKINVEKFLSRVERPARYIGSEWNIPDIDFANGKVRMAMAFPDLYEVGMSHLGIRILYNVVNSSEKYTMERVFAVAPDMEEMLIAHDLPMFTLETNSSLDEFDLLGFSMQYELSISNVLNMLKLGRIPVLAGDRDYTNPLVIGGGPCVYNPEPYCDFFDLFFIGEGEEAILDILALVEECEPKKSQSNRDEFLRRASHINGVYVPSLYDVTYEPNGNTIVSPLGNSPLPVEKVLIRDLDKVSFPQKPLVPHTEIVHERAVLELFRGCARGCRFCQAGMIYRPRREKDKSTLVCDAMNGLANTGYDELGLLSLSTMDYSQIKELVDDLNGKYANQRISLSLPSLRMDAFSIELAKEVQKVRRGSLTLAPEAGSQRMRDMINKNITEDDIINTVMTAFEEGFANFKFYFMIGLPNETLDDIKAITELIERIMARPRELGIYGKKPLSISVSIGTFVPKPQTPFQWCGQEGEETICDKQRFLKDWSKNTKGVRLNYHDFETSFLEAVIARGDRRLGKGILKAHQQGAKLDGWSEYFKMERWEEAFYLTDIDPHDYANKCYDLDINLPWDHISAGVSKAFYQKEYQKSVEVITTKHCFNDGCVGCGVCQKFDYPLPEVKSDEEVAL